MLKETQRELLREPIVGQVVQRLDRYIYELRHPVAEEPLKRYANAIDLWPSRRGGIDSATTDDNNNNNNDEEDDESTFVGNHASVRDFVGAELTLRDFTATLVGNQIYVVGGVRLICFNFHRFIFLSSKVEPEEPDNLTVMYKPLRREAHVPTVLVRCIDINTRQLVSNTLFLKIMETILILLSRKVVSICRWRHAAV